MRRRHRNRANRRPSAGRSTTQPIQRREPTANLPVLAHERLDWSHARYEAEITVSGKTVQVEHKLDCPEIKALIRDAYAKYAVETRCTRTMLSHPQLSADPVQLVTVTDDMIEDALYLIPGIVATRPCELPAHGLHPMILDGRRTIEIPSGWWLARDDEWRHTPLIASLLNLIKNENLKNGTMTVEENTASPLPKFTVSMAPDLHRHAVSAGMEARDVYVAALIGVFSMLPDSALNKDGRHKDSEIANALREKFMKIGAGDWDSEDGFDAARAATLFEPFHVPKPGEDVE